MKLQKKLLNKSGGAIVSVQLAAKNIILQCLLPAA
jgi:hypothetical protein